MGETAPTPRRRRLGKRRRRLRAATLTVSALLLALLAAGYLLHLRTRPPVRLPGEDLEDVTTRLSEAVSADAPELRWTDVTAAAGLSDHVTFAGARSSQLPEDMGSGAAWGDFDNDGDDDLFLVAAGGSLERPAAEWAPSRLYENRGDGTFRRDESFPDLRILGMAAAWGDYDGDGWLDLVVTGYRALHLFRNAEGRLVESGALGEHDGYWSGATWGDFDNDRDLDLYVCGYVDYRAAAGAARRPSDQYGTAVPFTLNPASYEPLPNLLFENLGDGGFREVALGLGVSNPQGRSLGALWHDFDADGRLDLYVANDLSDNALYLNAGDAPGERFEDAGLRSLVADYRGAMGLAAGDWNRDGDDDLFITHWVAQENALYDSRLLDGAAGAERRLTFGDLSAPLGLGQVALPMVGWGTEFADLDADGWLDLVVANGSTFEDDGEPKGLVPQPPFLFWNRRGERFDDLAPGIPALAEPHVGRGLAVADHDLDGDLDLLFVDHEAGVRLLRNDSPAGRWLELRLRSLGPAEGGPRGFAYGTTVVARVGDRLLRRTVGGASYLSQSSTLLHLGLGDAEQVDELTVHWLGGETTRHGPLAAGSRWRLDEGEPEPQRLAGAPSRAEVTEFWRQHRAAMDAMKRDGDLPRAIAHFRRALAIDPEHADARYYLANCLATSGEQRAALAELDRLRGSRPRSQRAHSRWAVLRALTATTRGELEEAAEAAQTALEINPEETGSLLLLGELALLLGDAETAEDRLELACRTNPRATGGFFLRAFIAHRAGRADDSRRLLAAARATLGEEWKPEGAAAEGDVAGRMHSEESPLAPYWQRWDGTPDPAAAFAALERRLAELRALPAG